MDVEGSANFSCQIQNTNAKDLPSFLPLPYPPYPPPPLLPQLKERDILYCIYLYSTVQYSAVYVYKAKKKKTIKRTPQQIIETYCTLFKKFGRFP